MYEIHGTWKINREKKLPKKFSKKDNAQKSTKKMNYFFYKNNNEKESKELQNTEKKHE